MYTVKYQEEEFQVTLKNKIKIEKIKAFLLLKRIIRKGRILIPDNLKMYVLLTMCWILYGAVVYFCGKIYKPIVKETIGVGVNEKAVLRFYQTALSFTSISIFPW